MNYYMNIGCSICSDIGRNLYPQEIGLIRTTRFYYGSLLDPNCTWLEIYLCINTLKHIYIILVITLKLIHILKDYGNALVSGSCSIT